MKETLKIPLTFQGTFSSDSVVQVIILVHLLKKENRELMAKVNLDQTRPSHVSENYTSHLYQCNAQLNQDMNAFLYGVKKELFQRTEQLSLN